MKYNILGVALKFKNILNFYKVIEDFFLRINFLYKSTEYRRGIELYFIDIVYNIDILNK